MAVHSRPLRLLYVSHTSAMGGAERSLLELLGALDGEVDPVVACPPGALAAEVAGLGLPCVPIDQIDGGARLHPRHTTTALRRLARGAKALRRHAFEADLVHANMVRAGLMGAMSTPRRVPLIVHVRDAGQRTPTWAVARRVVGTRATALIANSQFTVDGFSYPGMRAPVHVIPPPLDLDRFRDLPPRERTRAELGIAPDEVALGVIGYFSPIKGQDTAILALPAIRRSIPNARLFLVGGATYNTRATTHDNAAYARELDRLAGELDSGLVVFTGQRSDAPAIMAALDVVLVPSWSETWGRTVVESMAAGTSVVSTNVGGPSESIEDGETGLLIPPRDPKALTAAVVELADPERRARMAAAARRRVGNWSKEAHAARVLDVYAGALGTERRPPATSSA